MSKTEDIQQQISQMISLLISGELNEKQVNELFEKISNISPDPEWSDYVFQSMEYYNEDETLNVDAIVRKIFSYQTIQV